jgi:hypothetical protein
VPYPAKPKILVCGSLLSGVPPSDGSVASVPDLSGKSSSIYDGDWSDSPVREARITALPDTEVVLVGHGLDLEVGTGGQGRNRKHLGFASVLPSALLFGGLRM